MNQEFSNIEQLVGSRASKENEQKQSKFFCLLTFGCKINQYESQAIREAWLKHGFEELKFEDLTADTFPACLIINSCAVTKAAVAELRLWLRKTNKLFPQLKILLTGCAVTVFSIELQQFSTLLKIIPNSQKNKLTNNLFTSEQLTTSKFTASNNYFSCAKQGCPPRQQKYVFLDFKISTFGRARPIIKVQDGCSQGCTYCIVPLARGATRSRQPQSIVSEIERLIQVGFKEFIISGINLKQYKCRGLDFWGLMTMLEGYFAPKYQDKIRWRISSLEPSQLNFRALAFFKQSRLLCPHLHIALQSGSESVLKRMGRYDYNPKDLFIFFAELKKIWSVFALGADILLGFPGESEDEFVESREFIEKLPLTYAHVFPYSPRPYTKAFDFKNQIKKTVRQNRASQIRQIVKTKQADFLQTVLWASIEGKVSLSVVLENDRLLSGTSEYYIDCYIEPESFFHTAQQSGAEQQLRAEQQSRVEQAFLSMQMYSKNDLIPVKAIAIQGQGLRVKILI